LKYDEMFFDGRKYFSQKMNAKQKSVCRKIKGQTFYQAAEQTYSKFVTLTAVPEPTVVTFGGLGALLLLRRHRA
jgi:hypothetical protein